MLRMLLSVLVLSTSIVAQGFGAQGAPSSQGHRSEKPTAVVNLNTATASELESLPGVGPKMAARILEYRKTKGPFKKIEELMNVQGIGEKSFLKLKPQLTVSARPEPTAQH